MYLYLGIIVIVAIIIWYLKELSRLNGVYVSNCAILSQIEQELNKEKYIDYNESTKLIKYIGEAKKAIRDYVLPFLFSSDISKSIREIRSYHSDWSDIVLQHNNLFIDSERQKLIGIIGSQFEKLTNEQKEAVVQDEINCLVLAGAGSGKTSTLVARVKYIVTRLEVAQESILLLAFTKNTANSMKDRLAKVGLNAVKVRTFHSLGMDILNKAGDSKITMAAEVSSAALENFVTNVIKSMLGEDNNYKERMQAFLRDNPDLKERTVSFVAYKLQLYKTMDQIKTKAEQKAYLQNYEPVSLKGETLKSYEEVMIANFFYIQGVEYEYEALYKHKVSDKEHRQYRPDFFLPKYGIYVEHFAINEKGFVPQWFTGKENRTASQVYNDGIRWKRNIHKTNRTNLIETYSYEVKQNTILDNLKLKLQARGVIFKEKSNIEIRKTLEEKGLVPAVTKLIVHFIALYRCSMMTEQQVYKSAKEDLFSTRSKEFLDIFFPLYYFYESYLRSSNQYDFHDLLIQPSNLEQMPKEYSKVRYVLVDEFQDMSMARFQLLKKLREANKDIKLFCVGDDWQSIYKFSGTDISLMKKFTEFFGYKREVVLPHTFRFHDKLLQLSKGFVLKNPHQIPKKFISVKNELTDVIECIDIEARGVEKSVNDIYTNLCKDGKKKSVQVLARYNYEIKRSIKAIGQQHKLLSIEYNTVHAAKGLEADYVILLPVRDGRMGFPTGIVDDPILELVKVDKEDYPSAEERRLFYVALTRTKNKVFLLYDKKHQSPFITEMIEDLRSYEQKQRLPKNH